MTFQSTRPVMMASRELKLGHKGEEDKWELTGGILAGWPLLSSLPRRRWQFLRVSRLKAQTGLLELPKSHLGSLPQGVKGGRKGGDVGV